MNKYFGLYAGTVINHVDPLTRNRLLVQVPAVAGIGHGVWAEAAQPRGVIITLPPPGTPVWVMYAGGDSGQPVWMAHGSDTNIKRKGSEPYAVVTMDTVQSVPAAKTFTGPITFTNGINFTAGGTGSSTFAGPATFTGTVAFTNTTSFSGANTFTGVVTGASSTWTSLTAGAFTATGAASFAGASFSGAVTVPAANFPIAATSGLQAALDSKYGASNPPPAPGQPGGSPVPANMVTTDTAQTITGAKTFSAATTVFTTLDVLLGSGAGRMRLTDDGANSYIQYDRPLKFAPPYSSAARVTFGTDGSIASTGIITENGQRLFGPSNPQPVTPPSIAGAMMLMGA